MIGASIDDSHGDRAELPDLAMDMGLATVACCFEMSRQASFRRLRSLADVEDAATGIFQRVDAVPAWGRIVLHPIPPSVGATPPAVCSSAVASLCPDYTTFASQKAGLEALIANGGTPPPAAAAPTGQAASEDEERQVIGNQAAD
jgi:hypothetical protein